MRKRHSLRNEVLFGAGASGIILGYTSLLVYYAVWAPSIISQAPLATELQRDALIHVEENILTFFNSSKARVSVLGYSLSQELVNKPDTWDSMQALQSELWGTIRGTAGLGSVVFQSTSNLSVSYFTQDGPIVEFSRETGASSILQQYEVDSLGHRSSTILPDLVSPPFFNRSWYQLAAQMSPSPVVSSTVGLFGRPLLLFSVVVQDGETTRGVAALSYPLQELQSFVERLNNVVTVYLLNGGSCRLIASIPSTKSIFANATESDNSLVASSARQLTPFLLDSDDHQGQLRINRTRYYYGIRKLATDYNVTIVALIPRNHYFHRIDKSTKITIAIFVTAIALWLLFASLVGLMLYRMRKHGRNSENRADHEARMHKEKQRMMARLSHEMRTPMAVMIGMLEVMYSECDQEQRGHVTLLQKLSNDMMQLLDGLLMLAKTEAGKSNVENQAFNLHTELATALESISPLTTPRGIQLIFEYGSDLGKDFLGDRRKIRQVIDNLLSNAAKFTEKGSITVRVSKGRFVHPHTQFVDVRVQDTGCGIPENRLEDIFLEFIQIDPGTKRTYGGSGLGLSIVRSLCKLMGGDVEIEHSSPEGTCFHFWLQLNSMSSFRKAETVVKTYEAPHPLQGLHILVAEDTRLLSKLIERLLTKEGADVTLTADGVEVVDTYQANPAMFSAILMDLQMPRMDGYDATRKIRALEAEGKLPGKIPIIALTAHAMDSDEEQSRKVGMCDYIRKPIDKQTIISTLLRKTRGVANSPRIYVQ
jgi:signal transduction histidine kinase/ActR/RegA family two-component response regulator